MAFGKFLRTRRHATRQHEKAVAMEPPKDVNQDLRQQSATYIAALESGAYDFVDLGTCDGGGFAIAERQGGQHGLGFDLEPSAVRRNVAKGLDVALYDVCELDACMPYVRFAVCSHILEHLPNLASIEKVLLSLKKLCSDFIIISGPLFENEKYFENIGIRAIQTLMPDHTCKMTLDDLQGILHRIGSRDYLTALTERMQDSSCIWFYDAKQEFPPEGLGPYDPAKHLPKPFLTFDRPIHRDFVCVVPLNAAVSCDDVLQKFYWGFDKIVMRATWAYT